MANGMPFIYDDIPSELYGVSLAFIDESYTNRPSGSGVEVVTDNIMRSPKSIYLGTKRAVPLSFNIEIVFDKPTDIFVFTKVKDWICGEASFKKLQICAENFQSFYFNCYIEPKEDLIYAGGYSGIKATVFCDAPWAWEFEKEEVYKFTDTYNPHNIEFYNTSADIELKPIIEITTTGMSSCSIINRSYNDRETKFTNLPYGEIITLDNEYGFMKSTQGATISNFNKVFFKLKKGVNYITVSSGISKLVIKYQNARRIGGGYY